MYALMPPMHSPGPRYAAFFRSTLCDHVVIGKNINVSSFTFRPLVEAVPGGMGIDGGPVVGERCGDEYLSTECQMGVSGM